MMAYVLIYKALDENGDKLFTLDDKSSLLNNVDQSISKSSNSNYGSRAY